MMITQKFKEQVLTELRRRRELYDGRDGEFGRQWSLPVGLTKRLLTEGSTGSVLTDAQWLDLGRELDARVEQRSWQMARTQVFGMISEDVAFCQQYAKGKICVDDCGIGKTFSAQYLSKSVKNCFYVDGSQAKTKQAFIRLLAIVIGVSERDRFLRVKANIKYALKMMEQPVVIIDEAGDLDYPAFLELKELWNATDQCCGWYLMGADGLRAKIERGIHNRKVGYAELFSRYSERYSTIVPTGRQEKLAFYRRLITDVLSVNMEDKSKLGAIVQRCLVDDGSGHIGGLRRAEALLLLQERLKAV
jgi:hypothetical protein